MKYVDRFCIEEEIETKEYCKIYKGIERVSRQPVYIKVFQLAYMNAHSTIHNKIIYEMSIADETKLSFIAKPLTYLKTENNMYHVF